MTTHFEGSQFCQLWEPGAFFFPFWPRCSLSLLHFWSDKFNAGCCVGLMDSYHTWSWADRVLITEAKSEVTGFLFVTSWFPKAADQWDKGNFHFLQIPTSSFSPTGTMSYSLLMAPQLSKVDWGGHKMLWREWGVQRGPFGRHSPVWFFWVWLHIFKPHSSNPLKPTYNKITVKASQDEELRKLQVWKSQCQWN